jgi:hypothetical protein
LIFIVRTDGEQPTDPSIRVVLVRRTPLEMDGGRTQFDVLCAGDEDARARLQARHMTVIACHDGWYADDHQGGIAVWGGGRHWEVRDTPLHVKEQGD